LDLETAYSDQDYIDVATKDDVRVLQAAIGEYAIHQFKDYVLADSCVLEWEGQSNCAPAFSKVYLQIFNRYTPGWETIDTDDTSPVDTDFILTKVLPDLTEYKDTNSVIVCRVYQEGI